MTLFPLPGQTSSKVSPDEKEAAAGGGGEKKPDKKKKPRKKKIDNEKPPKESSVVLKIGLHCQGCDGCIDEIEEEISKLEKKNSTIKGFENLTVDGASVLVTVKGTMDAKELALNLEKKLKKTVKVVPPTKKDDGGGKKKDNKEAAGGGENKEAGGGEKNKKAKETAPAPVDKGGEKDKAVAAGGGRDGAKDENYGCPYPQPENRSEKKMDDKKPPKESTVVLKIGLHCQGCDGCIDEIEEEISKLEKKNSTIKGFENLTVDGASVLVTVKGTMDAKELALNLEKKLKKTVKVVPPTKKDDGGGKKKDNKEAAGGGENKEAGGGEKNKKAKETAPAPVDKGGEKDKAVAAGGGRDGAKDENYGCPYPQPENRSEKKMDDKKPPKESTVVLKIGLHCQGCDGCIDEIEEEISKLEKKNSTIKGFENLTVDGASVLVTVKGTMDAKELALNLEKKLKKTVKVVPPTKKDDGGGKKKDNKEAAGGGENKEASGGEKNKKAKETAPAPVDKGGEKDKAVAAGGGRDGAKDENYGCPYPQPENRSEKKMDDKKPPKESTVVLKIGLHCQGCDGCIDEIEEEISKLEKKNSTIKGFENLTVDGASVLVTVKGTMDAKELALNLEKKLKKTVKVVPPTKKDDGGGKKKDNKEAAGRGENKEASGGEMNKKAKETAPAPVDKGREKDKAVAAGGSRDGAKDENYGYPYPYPQPENYWSSQEQQAQPRPQDAASQSWYPQSVVSPNSSRPLTPGSSYSLQRPTEHSQTPSHVSPGEAAGVIALLKDKSVDELWKLLSDKDAYHQFLLSVDQVKIQNNRRDELRKETLQVAEQNLEKELHIMELRNQCKIIRTTELAAAQEKLNELNRQKEELLKFYSPGSLLQKLQEAMNKTEEESDALHRQLLDKERDIVSFVQKYKKLRTIYYQRALIHLAAKTSSIG